MRKTHSIALLSLAVLALPALALPGPASASFDKGALFTVAGYTGTSTLSGFPVLVRIAENSPSGFSYDDLQSKATGADIAFVDMSSNGLPFEIDTWNPNGTSLIWVRLPTMAYAIRHVLGFGLLRQGRLPRQPVERLHGRLAHGRSGRWRHERSRFDRQPS